MRKQLIILYGIFMALTAIGQPYVSQVWVADQGDGTYINPILHADYPDPDVCVAENDFYMTASSFGSLPGLPILHSKDLVNWRLINYAVKQLEPVEFFNNPQHGKGIWAPCIRYHNNEFYIYWGDPDFGIYMVKTTDPAGEWDKPVLVKPGKGLIDPTPLWDDDGKAYLAYALAGSRSKINSILLLCEMNPEGTQVITGPVMIFEGNESGDHTVEGPKLYKRNGYYYIFAPAGGVEQGWQLAMRSKNIYGPYESRIVMAQGESSVNGPHQGGWVDTPAGESWFVHFQDKGAYGRIIHLNPMQWRDDWPVIGTDKRGTGCGEPVTRHKKPDVGRTWPVETPVESDEFNTRQLGLQWEWHANYQDVYGFTNNLGFMRIYSHILSPEFVNFWEVPNLLLQKFMAEEFTATTKVKLTAKEDGQKGGLIIMGWDYSYLGLKKEGDQFILEQGICKDAEQGNPEDVVELARFKADKVYEAGRYPNYRKEIYLRVQVSKGGMCRFFYSMDDKKYKIVGQLFNARQGKWIGAKVGYYSVAPASSVNRAWLDADWFRVTKK
ncbi:MAG: glycoside hydrolase 43 family protein [Tannerellaceae bacterium]|nr:glycoside hydrolase 43 family protein [Tannerellaceae bacterium]